LAGLTLRIDCISKTLGTFRLRDINFEVDTSEYFVLLGPTGAGKTVLLEMIMGFHRPDKGRIFLDCQDVTDVPTEKRGIGYVPQNCPLFPHMSIFENVEFGLKMQRVATVERKKAVDRMLEIMGLEEMSKRTPLTLSGGERQKVVLARVLVTRPKVVLLDEPLSNLDAKIRLQVRAEIRKLQKELAITTIYVTHDQEEALTLSDRIAVIEHGRIAEYGTHVELLERNGHYANLFRLQAKGYR